MGNRETAVENKINSRNERKMIQSYVRRLGREEKGRKSFGKDLREIPQVVTFSHFAVETFLLNLYLTFVVV